MHIIKKVVTGLFAVWLANVALAAPKPNILIILADDLGYADVGAQGCKDIPTPNIDSIARQGIRCTSGYVSGPYCSPTRAALMSGPKNTACLWGRRSRESRACNAI